MALLVVTEQGAQVRCREGAVRVEWSGKEIVSVPLEQVERVLLMGNVGLSTGFLQVALDRGLPVAFLTESGGYRGRLEAGALPTTQAKVAQFRRLDDLPWRVSHSQALVKAKILSQRALLLRAIRNTRDNPGRVATLRDTVTELDSLMGHCLHFDRTIASLMGREGAAARYYFRSFAHLLQGEHTWTGRTRRPPCDPINALLSLGYGLLTEELVAGLHAAGLDPQIGFFHTVRGRVPGLAVDALECFRAPIADALALNLLNRNVLKRSDFVTNPQTQGVSLTKEGLALYLDRYQKRMTGTFRNRIGEQSSLRRELYRFCAHLRRVYVEDEAFRPYLMPQGGTDRAQEGRPRWFSFPVPLEGYGQADEEGSPTGEESGAALLVEEAEAVGQTREAMWAEEKEAMWAEEKNQEEIEDVDVG